MKPYVRLYDISTLTADDLSRLEYDAYLLDADGTELDPGPLPGYDVAYYYDSKGRWLGPDDDGVCLVWTTRRRVPQD